MNLGTKYTISKKDIFDAIIVNKNINTKIIRKRNTTMKKYQKLTSLRKGMFNLS